MTHPEFSESPFDDIDEEFAALLNGEQREVYHGYIIRSLEKERALILDSVVSQRLTFDDEDVSGYDNFCILIDTMTEAIAEDFKQIDGINYEDEIIASGKTVALFTDKNDPNCEVSIHPLHEGEYIRGEIDGLFLQEIPPFESLQNVIELSMPPEKPEDNNQFGISLRLKNAFFENNEGGIERIPDNYVVTIPLNYPTLKLDAIIKTENA